jgi:hypothetical protein
MTEPRKTRSRAPYVTSTIHTDLMRRLEDAARKWLIENNHHACHLGVDKSALAPKTDDVRYLSNLLLRVYYEGREEERRTSSATETAG